MVPHVMTYYNRSFNEGLGDALILREKSCRIGDGNSLMAGVAFEIDADTDKPLETVAARLFDDLQNLRQLRRYYHRQQH